MRKAIVVAVSAVVAVAAVAASVATADSSRVASPAAPNCKLGTIALTGPYTGPAGSAGLDQRNWGRIFLTDWNAGRAIPGVPKSLKRTKLKAVLPPFEADAAKGQDMLESVPASYVIIDQLQFLDLTRRYTLNTITTFSEKWEMVYESPKRLTKIYRSKATPATTNP